MLDTTSILSRLRIILEGEATRRGIASGRFSGDLWPSLDVGEQVRRALASPRFDVTLRGLERSDATDGITSHAVYRISVTVRVVRALTAEHVVSDATRDNVAALASIDGDMIAQAFSFENTIPAVGVVSGKLEVTRSTHAVELSTDAPSHVTTEHVAEGWVSVPLDPNVIYLFDPVTESTARTYDSPITGSVMSGSNSMTWGIVFYQERVTPAGYGTVVTIYRGGLTGGVGNKHGVFTNNGAFYFRIYDGTGTLYGSATPTLGTSYDGTMVSLMWTYSSPTLRTYVNGVQYGSDVTTGGGITQVADGVFGGADKCVSINKDGLFGAGGNKNDSLWYQGVALSNTTALTPTQVAAWHNATRRQSRVASFPGCEYLLDMATNPSLGTTWTDQIGDTVWTRFNTSGTVQTITSGRWL